MTANATCALGERFASMSTFEASTAGLVLWWVVEEVVWVSRVLESEERREETSHGLRFLYVTVLYHTYGS